MNEEKLKPLGLSLRKMLGSDLELITAMEHQVSTHGWSRKIFQQSLGANRCFVLEGLHCQAILGFCVLQNILDEVHILNVCIAPEYQRRGWGEALLTSIIEDANEQGAADIHLEVRASNMAARNIYHKLGFNDVGIRKNYYSAVTGREDALQMCLTLKFPDFN